VIGYDEKKFLGAKESGAVRLAIWMDFMKVGWREKTQESSAARAHTNSARAQWTRQIQHAGRETH